MVNDDLKNLFRLIQENKEERLYKLIFGDCLRENASLSPEYETWADLIALMNQGTGRSWKAFNGRVNRDVKAMHDLILKYSAFFKIRAPDYTWERGFITEWKGYFSDVNDNSRGNGLYYNRALSHYCFWFPDWNSNILFTLRTLSEAQDILSRAFGILAENIVFENPWIDLMLEG